MNDYNQCRWPQNAFAVWTVFVVVIFIASCSKGRPKYTDFTTHDRKYYSEVAEGCETLLSQTNSTTNWWILNGDDKSLPDPLRKLNATKIEVAKRLPTDTASLTGVTIIFGEGRGGFVVSWAQKDNVNSSGPWELSAMTETGGDKTVVFSK